MRTPAVPPPQPQQQQWVVQPLVDVGLGRADIEQLLLRLAFDAVVDEGEEVLACAWRLVAGCPPEVQAAWTRTLARMLTLDTSS